MALLLATLVLAVVLGVQAGMAATYHRATAQGVLRDYASAAAETYAQRAGREFEYYGVYPTFRVLARVGAGETRVPLPEPAALPLSDASERQAIAYVRSLFRVDLNDGSIQHTGARFGKDMERWLADTLQRAAHAFDPEWVLAVLVDPSPAQHLVVYTVQFDEEYRPLTAYGVELDPDSVRSLFAGSATRAPLLPTTLTRRSDPDSLMSIELRDGLSRVLARSGIDDPAYSPYRGETSLGPRAGGLVAQVALRPEAAEQLIIGGLPRGRLPLIGGLLVLTAGLILAALLLLRRESELQRLRTEFVSNVSHELRTPLAEIRMFAETLALGRVRNEAERQRSLEIIDQEARRLTHLVENVLQFSRAERNASHLSPEPTPLAPIVEHVTEVFAPLAKARAVDVQTAVRTGDAAIADRGAVQQMLLNLLDNAVKYGPEGQTVTVGCDRVNGMVQLWVEDEGPGIPHSDREKIWNRFSRLEREQDAAVAGTGIGLAVVRELAQLQSGRAWWERAPSGGSRFLIELPAAEDAP